MFAKLLTALSVLAFLSTVMPNDAEAGRCFYDKVVKRTICTKVDSKGGLIIGG